MRRLPYVSKEFREFLKKEEERRSELEFSFYEKACNFSEGIIKIRFNELKEKKMKETINFSGLRISPSGPVSFCIILFLILTPTIILLTFFQIISASTAFAIFVILGFFGAWIYYYPTLSARSIRAKASSEMVLSVLYMAISLREIPNLERAVLSAAENLDGPIGRDLKEVLWKLLVGKLVSVEDGLKNMTIKWYK